MKKLISILLLFSLIISCGRRVPLEAQGKVENKSSEKEYYER